MQIRCFDSAAGFYQYVEPFLLEREAEHNRLLNRISGLTHQADGNRPQPYLAVVEHSGQIVAVALGRLRHNFILSSIPPEWMDEVIQVLARDLNRLYGTLPGVYAPAPISHAFAQHWHTLTGQPCHLSLSERIFQLEKVIPVQGVPGHLRRATFADHNLLIGWLRDFYRDTANMKDVASLEQTLSNYFTSDERGFYLWETDRGVSMAICAGPTPNGMRIKGLYTPPECRRQGYASACVAALSQLMLDSGRRYCFLFINLNDHISNRISQRLGYYPICDADEYTFTKS